MDENTVEHIEEVILRLNVKLSKINKPDILDEWGCEISPEEQRIENEKYLYDYALTQGKIYALEMVLAKNGRW